MIHGLCRGENSLDEEDPPLDLVCSQQASEDEVPVDKERLIGDLVENVLENGRNSELRIKDVRGSKNSGASQSQNGEESTLRDGVKSKFKKILSNKLRRVGSNKEKKSSDESSRACSAENDENTGEEDIQQITVKQEPIDESEITEEMREERSNAAKNSSWWDGDGSRESPIQASSPSIFSPMHVTIKPDIELSNDEETDYVCVESKNAEVEMLEVEEDEDFGQTMPLTCDFCSETFISAAAWVRHLKTHPPSMLPNDPDPWRQSKRVRQPWRPTGEGASVGHRSHVCQSCSKRFYSNASLLIHIRTHTGEKPFVCDVCHKGFNVKSNLIRHMRTLHGKIVSPSQVEEKV
ncbi:hypothetical protein J437_LFUL006664 [Ladona fulva]|uniref:C2H2-type domain-containing protein n=1 Tax=Ladona fulva TaxID=123851 RepID=A0A8K0NY59_LADFU|nr:hypothetical protein J437_LFUL006664 [Ladona fulva]